ncbi:tetratricopeptide repeat protein [Bauldia sp.]|uniref:tetratricopeptide repeat protein n=1 Tax=Bauldia sp. TaxID=2575872 RepID=UPI003BAAAAFB
MNRSTLIARATGSAATVFAVSFLALSAPAYAASGSGGGGSSDEVTCREGLVYDKAKQMCVREEAANDADLYATGRAVALAGDYERALRLLHSVEDKNDAMVLTMIGYSTRKMGRVEEGIEYYHQALAIEPDNVFTREYLGEGYVSQGRYDLAEVQLAKIEQICGRDCEQYQDLSAAIAGDPDW